MKRLGLLEALLVGWQDCGVVFLVIDHLVLGGRCVVELFVQTLGVVEADPVKCRVFGVLVAGEAVPVDEFCLEGRDSGLGDRVV